MKAKIAAVIIITVVIGAVTINSFYLDFEIRRLMEEVEAFEPMEAVGMSAERLFDSFKRSERLLSLTVNHGDLTVIEELLSQMSAEITAGKIEDAKITKGRLIDALEHLWRLSGFNIDSIV